MPFKLIFFKRIDNFFRESVLIYKGRHILPRDNNGLRNHVGIPIFFRTILFKGLNSNFPHRYNEPFKIIIVFRPSFSSLALFLKMVGNIENAEVADSSQNAQTSAECGIFVASATMPRFRGRAFGENRLDWDQTAGRRVIAVQRRR